ncbi:energy-coupling factor transporter ATPase [Lactobacillus taiwanensis]|uniref:energy-coupling factor transporter ATPase n=1 Tax=Lactobacillus taiwanensis TaxID=508451 RepID=UPI000B9823BC|nr:energy-coupling factor transporter ATPase [Lactobacillus taiwanensis]OYR98007.1 energy-coupling factor transporter ATPase [Lactobacillus taiwanensis]OYS02960.1 energy-coupling factor transporter ATPase [Lactobacillus taiwanensis]OYS15969.1 energy-coupling factor transporter ATPase [Lactobacillus taiwanensis]OYS29234.1 energy-coupling factor transporter ATPase [Lactobacillus taiwanensis]OYS35144.1 energy-coupling factor transporter ATPase [Lactobacillus taiwanensis]
MSIKFKNVDYVYAPGTPFQTQGLSNISFEIKDGSFVAIAGHTGSGKSTLMQHFDGLLLPSKGSITIANQTITVDTPNKVLKEIRKKVGLVFQFPENQLFEETVLKDVMFGPLNFGFSEEKAKEQAIRWIEKVGLPEETMSKSPFELSGGQMRRVAIAGVMAYEPDILCLDEPAAGLDPEGQKQIFDIFKNYQKLGHTVILISHNMDDISKYADDMLVLEQGHMIKHASPKEVFSDADWVKKHYLDEPAPSKLARSLQKVGFHFSSMPLTVESLVEEISKELRAKGGN